MGKILKCADNDDIVTLRADSKGEELVIVFEGKGNCRSSFSFIRPSLIVLGQRKVSEFKLKLMQIEAEQLGIPDTEYSAVVTLPSSEFQRIVRDLSSLAVDTVVVGASKVTPALSVRKASNFQFKARLVTAPSP